MSDSEVIEGTEEIQSSHIYNKLLDLHTKPVTITTVLSLLKALELLDSDFDVDKFLLEVARQKTAIAPRTSLSVYP